jgi:hypothetical protein
MSWAGVASARSPTSPGLVASVSDGGAALKWIPWEPSFAARLQRSNVRAFQSHQWCTFRAYRVGDHHRLRAKVGFRCRVSVRPEGLAQRRCDPSSIRQSRVGRSSFWTTPAL